MTDDRFRIGMLILGVGVNHTLLHQVTKTAFDKVILVAVQQVCSQTINRDLQHEPDIRFGLRICINGEQLCSQEQRQERELFITVHNNPRFLETII